MKALESKTLEAIRRAVRIEAGKQILPEDRFDIVQELALKLVRLKDTPDEVEAWITTATRNFVNNWLKHKRIERETLEGLYTLAATPRYNVSLSRDPMVNYMAVKPVLRGSGENDVENAVIAAIDARAKWKRGPKPVPTCRQDLLARKHQLAQQIRTVGKEKRGKK